MSHVDCKKEPSLDISRWENNRFKWHLEYFSENQPSLTRLSLSLVTPTSRRGLVLVKLFSEMNVNRDFSLQF